MASMNMTGGSISKHLIRYAVPLILSNFFQLTYNAVDSMVAGHFIGRDALAAQGVANPVMNIVILAISGICIGASVLMSEFFGAGQTEKLKKEFSTTLIFGFLFSCAIVLAGILTSRPLLRALNVSDDLLDSAAAYLRVTFIGAPFTCFYNAVASALKSVGDSKTPLKFVAFSAGLNVVLDLIFVGALGCGIVSSAATTVVAEAASAILCIAYVYRKIPLLQLRRGEFHIDGPLLKQTLQYGSVTALQQACQPIGKLFIQGSINSLGTDAIATYNAVTKIDDFAYIPEQNISHAMTTFIAQNRGANQKQRIMKGFFVGMAMEFGYWIAVCALTLLLRAPIIRLFIKDDQAAAIVALGSQYLGIMAFCYILPAFTNGFQGFFRGMGSMKTTLIGTLIQITLRVIFVRILTPTLGILAAPLACVAGWSVMLVFEIISCVHIKRRELSDFCENG